jgi:hypothetical protein
MVVRATVKALGLLGQRAADLPDIEPSDDDWYVNLLWLSRRKCLLLTHAGTGFSLFVPDVRKSDLVAAGVFFVEEIRHALDAERVPLGALGPLDPTDVAIAKTASRRVLGWMNELAHDVGYMVAGIDPQRIDGIAVTTDLNRILLGNGDGRSYATALDRVTARRTAKMP